jgi:hypothetical protein
VLDTFQVAGVPHLKNNSAGTGVGTEDVNRCLDLIEAAHDMRNTLSVEGFAEGHSSTPAISVSTPGGLAVVGKLCVLLVEVDEGSDVVAASEHPETLEQMEEGIAVPVFIPQYTLAGVEVSQGNRLWNQVAVAVARRDTDCGDDVGRIGGSRGINARVEAKFDTLNHPGKGIVDVAEGQVHSEPLGLEVMKGDVAVVGDGGNNARLQELLTTNESWR